MPHVETPIIVGIGAGPTAPVSITFVSSGLAGSALSPADTGVYAFPSQIVVGGAPNVNSMARGINVISLVTATAATTNAFGVGIAATLVAAGNGHQLTWLQITPTTATPGAFTGLVASAINIAALSVATYASPADPAVIRVGVLTGTGATNAYGILIAPPVGATNNYLIAHTTPGTFNVTSTGTGTFGGGVIIAGTPGTPIAGTIFQAPNVGFAIAAIAGASADFAIVNPSLSAFIMTVPTGTLNVSLGGGITVAVGSVLKLGNARSPGIVAQGGTVTMQDSTGTTIQVLVA